MLSVDAPGVQACSLSHQEVPPVLYIRRIGAASYGRDPHHHLAVGGGADPRVVGPQLAQDVQDGVPTVVVQDSS